MTKTKYFDQANALSKAIDLAIEAIQKFPPKEFNGDHINHFVKTYMGFKNNALNPELEYQNLKSLSYLENNVLTYFQEGTGKAIHYFWEQIGKQDLGFKRENKLAKILKRQKIKNQLEYDFIVDVLVPYQQQGLINKEDLTKLNQMISEFEK